MQSNSVTQKLIVLSAVLLVILSSVGYVYYGRWKRDVNQSAKVLPILSSAALVFDTDALGRQWKDFTTTAIGRDLSALPLFSRIQADLAYLVRSGLSNKALEELPLVVAVHGMAEEELGYVFYADTKDASTRDVLALLESFKKEGTYKIGSKKYAGQTITTISDEKSHTSTLYIIKQGSYMMASFSELLIEDMARGLADKKPGAFLSLKRSAFKQGGVYMNVPQIPALLRIFFKQQHMGLVQSYCRQLLPNAQLEFKWSNHYVRLAGLLQETPNAYVAPFAKGEPVPFSLSPYIPSHTAIIQCHTFKDAATFLADGMARQQHHSSSVDPMSLNYVELLNVFLDHDIAHATMGMEGNDQLLLIGVNTADKVLATLEELQLITAPVVHQPVQDQELVAYNVNTTVLKHWLPVALFPDFEPTLLTLVDNCLVLFSNVASFEQFKQAYNKGAMWSNQQSDAYRFVASTLPHANFNLFINLSYAWPSIASKLKPTWKALLEKQVPFLQQTGYASLQFVNGDQRKESHPHIHMTLAHMEEEEDKNPLKDEQALVAAIHYFQADAPIITAPHFVPTHKNEQPHLLLQDELYQLYFVDGQGKLIWKKRLEGPLVTDIQVLDLYKNNKCQYLFATAHALHLVDYTGQEVKPYPQPLPKPGKGVGIQLVDYDKDKNYRILLTDVQGNLYLRDMSYRPLPGWNPKALQVPFASTPFHIRVDKDYFFSLQSSGTLHGFNRKGQSCSGFPVHIKEPVSDPLIVQSGNQVTSTQLIVLTEEGNLNFYNLKGVLQRSIALEKTEDTMQFNLSSAVNERQRYVIFRQDFDKIVLLDEYGHELLEIAYESEKPLSFQYELLGEENYYMITDPVKQETYIYNGNGKLLNNGVTIKNNAKEVALSVVKTQQRLAVFTTFNKAILKGNGRNKFKHQGIRFSIRAGYCVNAGQG
eukprot:gene311-400_t